MCRDKRARGYQPRWRPRLVTVELLAAVDRVLARFAGQLPLTIRQRWYALVSDGVLPKEERTYKRLVEVLGMARRSGRIPWEAVRDDTQIDVEPPAFAGPGEFGQVLLAAAQDFRPDRQAGQPPQPDQWTCRTGGDGADLRGTHRDTVAADPRRAVGADALHPARSALQESMGSS